METYAHVHSRIAVTVGLLAALPTLDFQPVKAEM